MDVKIENKMDEVKKSKKKSSAKANGLKSVLIMDDKVLMTSFGQGNCAILEKEVQNDVIKDINIDDPVFDANVSDDNYEIKRKGVNLSRAGYIDKNISVRQDLIGAKDKLEERYFGEPMNNNIHIQVIYNILDMEKILAEYIDNIIYSISNVLKVSGEEANEFIGSLGGKSYENICKNAEKYEQFKKIYNSRRLRFLGSAFYDTGYDIKSKKGSENEKIRSEEDAYYILSLLGGVRQFTKHSKSRGKEQTWLYSLDRVLLDGEKELLDKLYASRLDSLNKNFIRKSAKDIAVAINVLGCKRKREKVELVKEYYRYVVCKDARNIGFSVKKLREKMIEKHMSWIGGKKYDTDRSKLYKLFDFIIYMYYTTDEGKRDLVKFVDYLRFSVTDIEKENVYVKQANMIWQILGRKFEAVANTLGNGSGVRNIKPDEDKNSFSIDDIKITAEGTSYFSKLMYLLTLLIDGKEINDLLTTIMSKLENIQSFEDVMIANNLRMFRVKKGEYDYSFFENAGSIANEIRIVKSVARMEKPLPSAKDFMFGDAMKLLGLEDYTEAITRIRGEHYVATRGMDDEARKQYYMSMNPGRDYNADDEEKFFKNDNSLRNFICNNILDSSRFAYIIRYTNIETARAFARSKPIVKFVLNKIPDSQIDSYWKACCHGSKFREKQGKVNDLANVICKFDTAMLSTKKVKEDKQAITAIIGLYLTVVHHVVKGLVNVNARYTMAIHALERDNRIIHGMETYPREYGVHYDNLFAMTNRYIGMQTKINEQKRIEGRRFDDEGNKIRKHAKRVNQHGLDVIVNSKDSVGNEVAHYHICRMYRNAIAHLGAVTNAYKYVDMIGEGAKITSYYALYHYFMQKYLMDSEEFTYPAFEIENSKIKEWAELVDKYKGYNKDWLWALNSPFAYNPPRYKCLSIEDKFYKDKDAVVKYD